MARAAVIPASPPKRYTRGTAKRTTTTTTTTTTATKNAKTATPVARTTTKAKAPTSATETRKRGVRIASAAARKRADDDSDEDTDDELGVVDNKNKRTTTWTRGKTSTSAATTASRGRKPVVVATPYSDSDDEDELAQTEFPTKRVGRPRTKPAEPAAKPENAPKPRGRPKGSTAAKSSGSAATGKETAQRKTRTQTKVNPEPQEAPKEVVTFRDPDSEEDMSEPIPAPAGRRRAATPAKKAGLGAKPVRNAPTTSGRGRKPAAAKKDSSKPLSPKKATQVAKSISAYVSSDGENDELQEPKSPMKIIVDSPTKDGPDNTGLSSPVKRINFTTNSPHTKVDENGEPTPRLPRPMDFSESLIMSSPARRPTPSPFSFSMRETPKRGGFTLGEDVKPLVQPDLTPTRNSPLKMSPKKANLETPKAGNLCFVNDSRPLSQPNFTPGHNSPLKTSPKKGLFGASFSSQPAVQASSTPLKTQRFLQSPAKKIVTPFKSSFSRQSPVIEQHQFDDEQEQDSHTPAQGIGEYPLRTSERRTRMELERDNDQVEAPTFREDDHGLLPPAETCVSPEAENCVQACETPEMDYNENEAYYQKHALEDAEYEDATADDLSVEQTEPVQKNLENHIDEQNDGWVHDDVEEEEKRIRPSEIQQYGDGVESDTEPCTEGHHAIEEGSEYDLKEREDYDSLGEARVYGGEETGEGVELVTSETHLVETEYHENPAEAQEQSVEPGPEPRDTKTEHPSPYRQSMIEGIEDVFVDRPLATDHMNEDPDMEATDEASEVEGNSNIDESNSEVHYELEDIEEDCVFDDDDETLVAFDTTGKYMLQHPQQMDAGSQDNPSNEVQNSLETIPSPRNLGDYRGNSQEEEDANVNDASELESISEGPSHTGRNASPQEPAQTEGRSAHSIAAQRGNRPRFTLLAEQLSHWKASSPEKLQPRRSRRRGVFSLAGDFKKPGEISHGPRLSEQVSYPDLTADEKCRTPEFSPRQGGSLETEVFPPSEDKSQEMRSAKSDTQEILEPVEKPRFDIFNDLDPEITEVGSVDAASNQINQIDDLLSIQDTSLDDDKENDEMPLPAPVTPMKNRVTQLQTFHTVSKVPLKGEGGLSPLKVSRKRGRSLSSTSPGRSRVRRSLGHIVQDSSYSPRKSLRLQQAAILKLEPSNSLVQDSVAQQSRYVKKPSHSSTPAKSPRRSINACSFVLRGAVVFVDVHTTEGEDASGIFVELLQQMGARCVKSWSWNPRASFSPEENAGAKDGRVGITHVVFKDGGVRTLEKVRLARGLVKCVGVGWVLDCERENKWLDEGHYIVDSSIIPRGGAKRRKSMEPRALSNVNGTLVKVDASTTASSGRRSGADLNAMENFKRYTPTPSLDEPSTPTNNRQYDAGHSEIDKRYLQTPKTPGYGFNLDNISMSPATPFHLSQRTKLVQQTCPPKQTQQGLFSKADLDGEPSQKLRAKLETARRKSLAYKPIVGSPLIE
ncbi:hypothetical protein EYZ11_005353 [Aspergillus tanneri]|uniref:BRCT domain-containing protein n=1 Tax=Aspergillus tanneri TaxID=1220188 RepID=A0A4S3JIQ4_9EURO|nr:hypothetical protein EYZ11_005353 [Aspergillus tanneri]